MNVNYVKLEAALPLRQALASTNESAGEKHVLWSCDTPSPEARGLRELSFALLWATAKASRDYERDLELLGERETQTVLGVSEEGVWCLESVRPATFLATNFLVD